MTKDERKVKISKINYKRLILLFVILVIVIVAIVLLVQNFTKKDEQEDVYEEEGYVQILEDGTRVNRSKKIKEKKHVEGLDIENIQLTEKDNVSVMIADVKNTTKEQKGDFLVSIQLLDGKGQEMIVIDGYIPKLEAGETTQLNVQTTLDYSDAYDIVVTKQ